MKLKNACISPVIYELLLICALSASGVAQTWTQLSLVGTVPAGRIQAAVAFDSADDMLIMFGGAAGANTQTTAPVQNDVWVLSYADGLGGTPTWTQLSPIGTPPSPRAGASTVYDSNTNSLIMFAGNPGLGGSCGTVNDLWLLSNANGRGGTPQWTQLSPIGARPPNRNAHTAVYDTANSRMVIFGGTDFCSNDFNDVWVLENANNSGGTPTWVQLSPTGGAPTARDSHAATYDPNTNTMTIFGGGGFTSPFGCPPTGLCNDLWVLGNANGLGGQPTWTQLSPTGGPPSPRNQLSAIYDSTSNRMTIFGGNIATSPGLTNDVWVLSEANGLAGTPAWTQLSPTGGPPPIRRTHSAVFNSATNRMTIFGGFTNTPSCCGSALNDTWVLADANGIVSGVSGDFSITATSPISPGVDAAATSTVTVTSLNGFDSAVALSVSALPTGISTSFTSASLTPPSGGSLSSTLTVSVAPFVTPSSFTLTVTGASGSLSHSASVNVNVTSGTSSITNVIGSLLNAGGIDNSGIATALTSKLSAAQSFINAGGYLDAINTLTALINQIKAQSGKHIATSCTIGGVSFNPANVLITDAQTLINSLRVGSMADPITGYVLNSSGAALQGTTVSILSGTTTVATAITDITGFYYFATTNLLNSGSTYTLEVTGFPSVYTTSAPESDSFTWVGSALNFNFTLN